MYYERIETCDVRFCFTFSRLHAAPGAILGRCLAQLGCVVLIVAPGLAGPGGRRRRRRRRRRRPARKGVGTPPVAVCAGPCSRNWSLNMYIPLELLP